MPLSAHATRWHRQGVFFGLVALVATSICVKASGEGIECDLVGRNDFAEAKVHPAARVFHGRFDNPLDAERLQRVMLAFVVVEAVRDTADDHHDQSLQFERLALSPTDVGLDVFPQMGSADFSDDLFSPWNEDRSQVLVEKTLPLFSGFREHGRLFVGETLAPVREMQSRIEGDIVGDGFAKILWNDGEGNLQSVGHIDRQLWNDLRHDYPRSLARNVGHAVELVRMAQAAELGYGDSSEQSGENGDPKSEVGDRVAPRGLPKIWYSLALAALSGVVGLAIIYLFGWHR